MFSLINGPSTCERLALDTASMYFGVEEALDTKPPLKSTNTSISFCFECSSIEIFYTSLFFSLFCRFPCAYIVMYCCIFAIVEAMFSSLCFYVPAIGLLAL